jgi:2-amino-4-hydroxy-6-hydroxymethyldihydropteridine diphosphokinase
MPAAALEALWHPAYIGVGSNQDDPPARVREALAALAELPQSQLHARSSLWISKPFGPVAQDDFCNAAAALLTRLPVHEFFAALRALEARLGRTPPRERWGPRRIDLDLLAFAAERIDSAELVLPHPGIVERNFVLYPLAEIAPALQLPGLGTVAELAARVSTAGIRQL